MIADAFDTLITLGWTVLAWIVLCALMATLVLAAVATVAWWLLTGLWRTVRAVRARGRAYAPPGGPESPPRLPLGLRGVPEPTQRRSEPRRPAWARKDHNYEIKDAA